MARYRRRARAIPAMNVRQQGFALFIVLLAVGFLALLGTQIVAAGRTDSQLAGNLEQEAVLKAAAEGAIARTAFLAMAARDPRFQPDGLVREVPVGGTRVLVRLDRETDRVNVNTATAPLLRALITEVGGSPQTAGRLAAAIMDWHTPGASGMPGGAKAGDYQSAGRAYGPPGGPFQSVDELGDVLGVTPNLFAGLLPHLTVFTEGDPDISTRDPIVARSLTNAGDAANGVTSEGPTDDQVLRISVTALGSGKARYSLTEVVSADLQSRAPRVNVLFRQHDE